MDASTAEQEMLKHRKSAYYWNTIGGLLLSCQSVFMLIIITRICDVYTAGVFTIAFAVGNLFMNLGWYGMRKFQASDREKRFTFEEYFGSRVITVSAMVVCSFAYVLFNSASLGYSEDKTLVIIVMCIFKTIECFEDVYSGGYQREDRLDVGARMLALRQIATVPFFAVVLAVCGSLLASLVATTVFSYLFFVGQVLFVRKRYQLPTRTGKRQWKRVFLLLKECLPLFIGAFLLFYISTAPRYAIDALLDDTAQAYFGYISMPVFVVTMVASFIYNPLITELTDQWLEGQVRVFRIRFAKISAMIFGVALVCVLGAFAIGVPVLNILFNTDISQYLVELLVLLAGGGFMAIIAFATIGITIIRFQKSLVPLYIVLAIVSYALSMFAIQSWGITGASWAYLAYMAVGAVMFYAVFMYGTALKSR